MQNKGAITLLTIALALVSLYQLSFTWKTNRVEYNVFGINLLICTVISEPIPFL